MAKKMKNLVVLLGDPKMPDSVKLDGQFNREDEEVVDILRSSFSKLEGYSFTYLRKHKTMFRDLKRLKGDINYVVNFCDEGYKNNPRHETLIPLHLEVLGLPYTGASHGCLSLCYNKANVKAIARQEGVSTAPGVLIGKDKDINKIRISFRYPLFVKPNYGDGSFAITEESLVHNKKELKKQIEETRRKLRETGHEPGVLVEKYLPSGEVSVAVIGNGKDLEIRLIQEDFSVLPEGCEKIISHEAKWDTNSPGYKLKSRKPNVGKETEDRIIRCSAFLFNRLECRDYARFDYRLMGNRPYFIEANPNPGWCWDGHLAKAFVIQEGDEKLDNEEIDAKLKENYPSVLKRILHAAEKRFQRQR